MESKFYLSEEDYNKGVSLMVRFCLDFAVVRDGKVLLSKRLIEPYKGFWHLPGGMLRKGETIKDATQRALMGELGLKPVSTELIGYCEYLNEQIPDKNLQTHSVSLIFKTVLEEGELKESFQAKEMEFFSEVPSGTIPPLEKFLKEHWSKIVENQ